MKAVIIIGSSRSDGNTRTIVNQIVEQTQWPVIDLNRYTFSYYDYTHNNKHDDYLSLLQNLVNKYDTFVFATPVYWYAMSGIMKVFFDRLTDVLTIEKNIGRSLRGKQMAVLSCSNGNHLGNAFWLPFIHTAKYLGMHYIGNAHFINNEPHTETLRTFVSKIQCFPPAN